MANFDVVRKWVGNNEGGFSTERKDPGNWTLGGPGKGLFVGTNYGVSGQFIYREKINTKVTEKWMRAMTHDFAVAVYRKHFWNPLNVDKIENDSIAYQFYDHRVNTGNIAGIKKNLISKYKFFNLSKLYELTDSEVLSINKVDSEIFYNDLKESRIKAYKSFKVVYQDWLKRPGRIPYQKKKPEPIRDLIIVSPLIVLIGLVIYLERHPLINK